MSQRKRQLFPYVIMTCLLYGRYGSVSWHDELTCTLRSRDFSATLGTNTTMLRRYLWWLKRNRFLTALEIGHGYCKIEIAKLPRRASYEDPSVA